MLNVDQLVAQFGAYYIPGGQNVALIKKALYAASKTEALFNDRSKKRSLLLVTLVFNPMNFHCSR